MFEFTEKMLKDLFYENDSLSLTRVIAFGGFATFTVGSLYLMITHTTWPDYAVFASYTGGIGSALQLGNKFINSKYNSLPGSYDDANSNGIPDILESAVENVKNNNQAIAKTVEGIQKASKVIDTVKDSSAKIKEGIDGITKLVRK